MPQGQYEKHYKNHYESQYENQYKRHYENHYKNHYEKHYKNQRHYDEACIAIGTNGEASVWLSAMDSRQRRAGMTGIFPLRSP